MNIKVSVLRNQSEIVLRCNSGEYELCWNDQSARLTLGAERKLTCSSVIRTPWCRRTYLGDHPIPDSFPVGVIGKSENGIVSSRRWLCLETTDQIESTDPLYTQACAIANSEATDAILSYRDERPKSEDFITMDWQKISTPVVFRPLTDDATIEIKKVRVGIGFHWDTSRDLLYRGEISIHLLADGLCAVISTPLEEYLAVVNSSEMPADLPLEFLKAQTVAARSWLLANLGTHHPGAPFDVCSDDHCQCYHGAIKIKEHSLQAARETESEILVTRDTADNRRITDARYAKTCGGRFEPGNRIWGGETPGLLYSHDHSDLSQKSPIASETEASSVILDESIPDYCNPKRFPYPASLAYCEPFYRWRKEHSNAQIAEWIKRSTGIEVGFIHAIEPLRRGPSGRLHHLQVAGHLATVELKGELAIRRALSDSHLPSSAFVVEIVADRIVIAGAGWGHGAGLCQTGAAVRAGLGQDYRTILSAYYPDSQVEKVLQVER